MDDNDQTVMDLGINLDNDLESIFDVIDAFSEDGGEVLGALDDALGEVGPPSATSNRASQDSVATSNLAPRFPDRESQTADPAEIEEGKMRKKNEMRKKMCENSNESIFCLFLLI